MSIQLMSVTYDELDSGIPALCICSELTIAITNKTLVNSFIKYYENELKFKISNLSGNKLSFSWYSEEEKILKIFIKHNFVGYIFCEDLYNVFKKISITLEEQDKK